MTKPALNEDLRIPKIPVSEMIARERAATFALAMGFGTDQIEDIKTAVSEASLNAIEHAKSDDSTDAVLIQFRVHPDSLGVSVSSKGMQFVPSETKPDIKDKIEGRDRPRGWGVYLIRKLADEVEFTNEYGVTTVRMRFLLQKQ